MPRIVQSTDEYLVDVFRALGDPLRLDIMLRMSRVDELPCTELEKVLPVTKSTISYHMKILHTAGLIDIRKAGRYYFYHVRTEPLGSLLPDLWPRLADLANEVTTSKASRAARAPAKVAVKQVTPKKRAARPVDA